MSPWSAMLQQALPVPDRLRAISSRFAQSWQGQERALVGMVTALAILGGILVLLVVVRWVRQELRIREQVRSLREAGVPPDRVTLYAAIARRVPAQHLRNLPRLRAVFDAAASDHLRRRAAGADCWDLLTSVLALRHFLQRQEAQGAGVSLSVGQAVWLRLADVFGQAFQTVAYVRDSSDDVLQLVYPARAAIPASIAVGLPLDVIVHRGAEALRARARVRGYHADRRGVQLLVDHPTQWTTASFDLGWRDTAEPVDVVLSERFEKNFHSEHTPRVAALVVRVCCGGIAIQTREVNLGFGESIRIEGHDHVGVYRTYAELRSADGEAIFFLLAAGTTDGSATGQQVPLPTEADRSEADPVSAG